MKGDPPMQDGSPHPNANRRGSVTIYAQAEDVTGCIGDPADTRSTVKMTGNSFASPAVAGLAAYLLAHPDFSDVFEYKEKSQREQDYRSVGLQMKQVIEAFASFQWVPQEAVFNRFREYEREEYELPKRVRIAYNMVDGPKRDVDAATQPADPNRQRLRERYHRFLDRLQQCNPMKVKRDGTSTEIDFCSATDTFTRVSNTVPPTSMASTSTGDATLTFKPTTLTGSTSTTATSSPVLTCNEDSECDGLTCKSTEAKKCKAKSAVAVPIPIKQCECVDPKEEDKVPAVCTVDEDCKALICDGSKKKSCVTTIPMGSFAIRQCKCTDPKPTTTSVAKPTTVAPKPPSTTVKAPTATSPAPMECNIDQAVNSCAGYKNCKETERGICKEQKTASATANARRPPRQLQIPILVAPGHKGLLPSKTTTTTTKSQQNFDTMRVLKLTLMVVAMALVHSAAGKHNNRGDIKGMQDLNDTQLDMEGPLDDNLWANGDESAVPIANEQQGEAVKFEA
ncbi:hypothetical protein CGCSCA4_v001299 [Colletotrichum siamense]|uniref:Peptidase S8/S53 domain-containing protein n=1 Tax=Colletotrichum siamense TaxID=690259 RepID=A0A9P5KAT7_COLSI|nr:hypothetical protein CGCSCA4_v001299 [Colletotrichum siamense]KAF4865241.1 hypothetical protein CGCSCA2_v001673 [Colletotrichum siamense]